MKLSTRKILGLDAVVLGLTVVLALLPLSGVWREYIQAVILALAIGAGVALLGWAKPRGRDTKTMAAIMVLAALVFQAVIFVFLGMRLGFLQNTYHWNWATIGKVFLPLILLIVAQETLRGQVLEKGKGSLSAIVMTTVTLIVVEVACVTPLYENYGELKVWFDLLVMVIFPTILKNIFLSYVALGFDYRINIGYRLVMELPIYVLPVWPDVSRYLMVVFELALVTVLLLGVMSLQRWGVELRTLLKRKPPKRQKTDSQMKVWQVAKSIGAGALALIMVVYVALMSGIFKWYFLAVGSNSMQPALDRGDMVLVSKTRDCEKIAVGDILVYSHDDVTMIHRVMEAQDEAGRCWFVTKGDANDSADAWVVEQEKVIGLAKGKIVAFGYPTLWLNELFNGGK